MKYQFILNDPDHKEAVNYDGTNFYNNPMTVVIENIKYVLGIGHSDSKSVVIKDEYFYLVAENTGLNYISLTVINTLERTLKDVCLTDSDINDPEAFSFDILYKETEEQIKILSEYL